jgi:citrate lyase subunit beta / citryl-CoA lyase
MTSHLLRSALYVPASHARALAKAPALGADVIIHDLEDAVAPEAKAEARAALTTADTGAALRVIRINGLGTEWHAEDVQSAAACAPYALLLPKVNGPDDIHTLRTKMPPEMAIWAMIETARGVLAAASIAEILGPTGALVLGLNDLARETGMAQVAGRAPMHSVLTTVVLAARAHGLAVLDGVFNSVHDSAGFAAECAQARAQGFDGKTLIHPDQVAVANACFAPTAAEMAEAQAIVAAFAEPQNRGRGAIALQGRMVERLHLDMAESLLAKAGRMAAR